MYKNKVFLLLFTIISFSQLINSQNNTNSPYTRFGYGEINDNIAGGQRAMGGVSVGVRNGYTINTVNPASYSAVDSMTFMFDMGASGLISKFTDNSGSNTKKNANLEYITMQFPITKSLGFSAGVQPYSFMGYNFNYNRTIIQEKDSTITSNENHNGSGGFNQVYTGISAKLINHIAVGINAYYLYGSINNNKTQVMNFPSESKTETNTETNSVKANNFRLRYGVQFYNTFSEKHDLTLGLIYEQKAILKGNFKSIFNDSISNTNGFEIPAVFGAGLYYTYDKRLSTGLDYTFQNWKDIQYFGKTGTLENRSKIAWGAEYLPNFRGRKYYERVRYRMGLNISDAYITVENQSLPKNLGLSFGFGLPLRNTATILNTSFEYGKVGTTSLLREDIYKLTFNIVFNEHWFFKRKL
jgi:hypothetical protein